LEEEKNMAVELEHQSGSKVVTVRVTGKLTKDDYDHFIPRVEELIKTDGKLRMLVEMHDFHGWDAGALWEDVKFDLKHFSDIERLAIVGETKWQKGMAAFCRPFTTAAVKYFDHGHLADARHWTAGE
jgi:SpoIIAA-like